ncbi:MAG: class I SAM-dependent methyltransferase [Rhizobiaceae bacterium]|nr:class I SAM-dependent methyltransferase [Rhizobiaceae bacterium]
MTPLAKRIAALIASAGPMSVADYMALCLLDPTQGYYTTREPFGREGDFTTAPEISQMFGELVGVWVVSAWRAIGSPTAVTVAEIGPGRGTLMRDVLRTLQQLAPALSESAGFALVEASPRLAERQRGTLASAKADLSWHAGIDTLPARPLIVLGNEIFDALPFRQFVLTQAGWRERMIGLNEDGRLAFATGVATIEHARLPAKGAGALLGSVFEIAPARAALMQALAERISDHDGAGLFFDYGHTQAGFGDTFQAVRRHEPEHVLASPGEADLTSHVDFADLAGTAKAEGLSAQTTTQGDFLIAMGMLERAGRLGAALDAAGRERISGEVERLAGPTEMGQLFKVLGVARPGTPLAGFGTAGQ